MKWTEEKTWYDNHHSNSSFISPANVFSNNRFRGLEYIKNEIVPVLGGGKVHINSEVMYQQHPVLQKIKDSSVLIIGGGPSAKNAFLIGNNYDFIVSCNHFFVNEKIGSMKIDLAFLGDEVDLDGEELKQYIEKSNTTFCFENVGHKKEKLNNFKNRYPEIVFWAHTRYHSKVGAVPRIASLIAALKPKKISLIGMDGYVPLSIQKEHAHSFQKNKGYDGSLEREGNDSVIIDKYKQQYLEFWDYILHDVGKNIEFYNLGHGHPCNLSTIVLTQILGDQYQDYLADTGARE